MQHNAQPRDLLVFKRRLHCRAGEENLTMHDDRHYSQENILIHEFGHSVMCIGMTDQQRQCVQTAFSQAQQQQLYHASCYSMEVCINTKACP